jgi:hypothetical protein
MLSVEKAEALAREWVEIVLNGTAAILHGETITRPYGWVFFYQSKAYIASGRFEDRYAGNAPIIINRYNGEVRVTGTAESLEIYLRRYESTLLPNG